MRARIGVTCAKNSKNCTRSHFEGVGREIGNRQIFSCGLMLIFSLGDNICRVNAKYFNGSCSRYILIAQNPGFKLTQFIRPFAWRL